MANININDPNAAPAISAGDATLTKGTTITLTSGQISIDGALTMTDNAKIVPAAPTSVGFHCWPDHSP